MKIKGTTKLIIGDLVGILHHNVLHKVGGTVGIAFIAKGNGIGGFRLFASHFKLMYLGKR